MCWGFSRLYFSSHVRGSEQHPCNCERSGQWHPQKCTKSQWKNPQRARISCMGRLHQRTSSICYWCGGMGLPSREATVVAWDYLRGKPYCGNFTTPYLMAHMCWGLTGTADAVMFLHIDSDGFSTFVSPVCGKKIWDIYCKCPELPLSSPNVFLDDNFLLDEVLDSSKFGLEAIVLCLGDLLYSFIIPLVFNLLTPSSFMRPGIPHFVYGPENTICYGSHFYTMCLMQLTLQSLMHSFIEVSTVPHVFLV